MLDRDPQSDTGIFWWRVEDAGTPLEVIVGGVIVAANGVFCILQSHVFGVDVDDKHPVPVVEIGRVVDCLWNSGNVDEVRRDKCMSPTYRVVRWWGFDELLDTPVTGPLREVTTAVPECLPANE